MGAVSGTLGKALGGASGGYVAARREVVELLRQRSRPYRFSNAVAPAVIAGSLAALDLVAEGAEQRARLHRLTALFRDMMTEAGFDVVRGQHAIVPVVFGDPRRAAEVAARMLDLGVHVVAFSHPVVPRDQARIRVQLSVAHTDADVRTCVRAFVEAARR